MSENTKQAHYTVQYNMCASHLVCMLTVISTERTLCFEGSASYLDGSLRKWVSAVHPRDPLPASSVATWFKPDGLRLEQQQPQRRHVECEHCTVSDTVGQTGEYLI